MSTYEPDLPNLQRTADHWDTWQLDQPATQGRYNDWGDHPTVFRAVMRHVFGSADVDFFSFLKQKYPGCAQAHALSLCCGDGAFEEQLLQMGVFDRITGLELSPQRIAHGQSRMSQCKTDAAGRLNFLQQDVNLGELHRMLRDQFDVLEDFALGGTVLHLLLSEGRVNRFDAAEPLHNAVLEEAVAFERQLISSGALNSDFRFIVARPKAAEVCA